MSVAAALRARLRREALEAELAAGADPWSSPELMACAAELTSLRARARLADAVDGLVTLAEHRRFTSPFVPIPRTAVLRERESLRDLADRLRAPAPVTVQGAALVSQLLRQARSSPVEAGDRELGEALDTCWRVLIPAGVDEGAGRRA